MEIHSLIKMNSEGSQLSGLFEPQALIGKHSVCLCPKLNSFEIPMLLSWPELKLGHRTQMF